MILTDAEYEEIRKAARARHMTMAERVRQALCAGAWGRSSCDVGKNLEVVRAAARFQFPTADLDRMLSKIEMDQRYENGPRG